MSDEIFNKLIEAEGGYKFIEVEDDKGGKTFAGISQKSNPDWQGWKTLQDYQPNKPLSENIIEYLKPLVKQLYRERYWKSAALDDEIFQQFNQEGEIIELKNMIFHISVLSGPRVAMFCLQNALGKIEPDGLYGPQTRERLGQELSLYSSYFVDEENNNLECIQRGMALTVINRFIKITDNDSSQRKFLRGWIKRFLKLVGE